MESLEKFFDIPTMELKKQLRMVIENVRGKTINKFILFLSSKS